MTSSTAHLTAQTINHRKNTLILVFEEEGGAISEIIEDPHFMILTDRYGTILHFLGTAGIKDKFESFRAGHTVLWDKIDKMHEDFTLYLKGVHPAEFTLKERGKMQGIQCHTAPLDCEGEIMGYVYMCVLNEIKGVRWTSFLTREHSEKIRANITI